MIRAVLPALLVAPFLPAPVSAQTAPSVPNKDIVVEGERKPIQLPGGQRKEITTDVDKRAPALALTAKAIWDFAEVGFQEKRSVGLLVTELKQSGFSVKTGVADMPTAFVATFKQGKGPVIGVLAEYDALPGLSQAVVTKRQPIANKAAGHGGGHNILGAASVTAAIAIKDWMVANKVKGELRVYGTPAEEGGSGKVYMVRAGLFDGVDAVLHWHPGDVNGVAIGRTQASMSGRFRFRGGAAHMSMASEGSEVMNVAVNFLREHVPDGARINHVIAKAGQAPDVADSYYDVRNIDRQVVRDVMARVQKAAEGAAMATGTTVEFEVVDGVYPMLGNQTLANVMMRNLEQVGGEEWTAEETNWAIELQKTLPVQKALASVTGIAPIDRADSGDSTDVADVSWVVPTVGLGVATWVPGTPAHSWQATAASGYSIGAKGGVVAAKTIALTGAELFTDPGALAIARTELLEARGADFVYKPMIGDRKPPLDYRATN